MKRKPLWEQLRKSVRKLPPPPPKSDKHPLLAFEDYARSLMTHDQYLQLIKDEFYILPTAVTAAIGMFHAGSEKIYKIARHFGEQLAKVDLELSPQILRSTEEVISVEFPDSIAYELSYNDGQTWQAHGAFIWVCSKDLNAGTGPDAWDFLKSVDGDKVLSYILIMTPLCDEKGEITPYIDLMKIAVTERHKSIDDAIDAALFRHPTHRSGTTSNKDFWEFLLKCLVYIQSGDPDLREYRPPPVPVSRKAKRLRQWQRDNAEKALVNMILVGYDFKKPKEYAVGETTVTGHFRWQPWGPERSRVKLIWIEPHLRRYASATESAELMVKGKS